MKKRLKVRRARNDGFFLPYTTFISMVVILHLITMVILYENKTSTNKTINELVETKTLIQMSKAKFINEKMYDTSESGEINFRHPNGNVDLFFEWRDEATVEASLFMETNQGTHIQRGFKLYLSEEVVETNGATTEE